MKSCYSYSFDLIGSEFSFRDCSQESHSVEDLKIHLNRIFILSSINWVIKMNSSKLVEQLPKKKDLKLSIFSQHDTSNEFCVSVLLHFADLIDRLVFLAMAVTHKSPFCLIRPRRISNQDLVAPRRLFSLLYLLVCKWNVLVYMCKDLTIILLYVE